jgi:hypothetical protein
LIGRNGKHAVDTPVEVVSSLLAMVMWSLAIGTLLQMYRFGPIGTGFMCPVTPTATYFAAPKLLKRCVAHCLRI